MTAEGHVRASLDPGATLNDPLVPDAEDQRFPEAGRYDAFLSYARADAAFAVEAGLRGPVAEAEQTWRGLTEELRAPPCQVWVDVEDIIGGAKWRERVKRGIEACKAFIFVMSPASLASEHCLQELADAVSLNKLIIPVVYQDADAPTLPAAVSDAEWVFLFLRYNRASGMDRLIEALETDLEWRDPPTPGLPAARASG